MHVWKDGVNCLMNEMINGFTETAGNMFSLTVNILQTGELRERCCKSPHVIGPCCCQLTHPTEASDKELGASGRKYDVPSLDRMYL